MNKNKSRSTSTQGSSSNKVAVHLGSDEHVKPFSECDNFRPIIEPPDKEPKLRNQTEPSAARESSTNTTEGGTLSRRSIIMSTVAAALASFASPRAVEARGGPNSIEFNAKDAIGLSHLRKASNFRLSKSSQITVDEVQGSTEDEVLEVTIDIAPKGGKFGSITSQKFTMSETGSKGTSGSPRSIVGDEEDGEEESEGSDRRENSNRLSANRVNIVKKTRENAPEQSIVGKLMRFHAARSLAPSERDLTQHHDSISLDDFHIDASIEELTKRENRIISHDYDLRVQLIGSGGTIISTAVQTITVEYGLKGGPGVRFAYNPLLVAPTDDTRSLTGN